VRAKQTDIAYSLSRGHLIGSIEPGKAADFVVHQFNDYRELGYYFGVEPARPNFEDVPTPSVWPRRPVRHTFSDGGSVARSRGFALPALGSIAVLDRRYRSAICYCFECAKRAHKFPAGHRIA
jgi:hypothetical protein